MTARRQERKRLIEQSKRGVVEHLSALSELIGYRDALRWLAGRCVI
jgi:hypothetical protein